MIAPARRAAFDALEQVDTGQRTLPDALARLRRRVSDARDVSLATDITIGTVRWRGTIDFLLAALSSRPLESLDAAVLRGLRLSTYQLVHLDRVPASAVVNDGVALVKDKAGPGAGGFVNALLRRLADPARRPALPSRPAGDGRLADWVAHLSATWSHPDWLVHRWLRAIGPEATESRLRYDQQHAPMTLRASARAGDRESLRSRLAARGVETAPTRFAPAGLQVVSGHALQATEASEGAFLVQDEGSQLVALYADAAGAARVLDVCAAPGGKTVAMAESAGPQAVVVAGDVRRRRVRLLRDMVRAAQASSVRVVAHDGVGGLPYRAVFDLVLVDAPCSGLGTLRRDPDVRWTRKEDDVREFARRQRSLLEEAAQVVAPGGRLVYATCSSEPEEGEDLVAAFLGDHAEFGLEDPRDDRGRGAAFPALFTPEGFFRTWPHAHGLDSFFAAVLRRRRYLVNPKHL